MQEHHIPVLDLFGHVVVPLQGDVSDSQMHRLRVTVLDRIRARSTDGLVIDASGVWMMDSHLCAVLGALAKAARLMGARPVLCGLGPDVVMTLQAMGVQLEGIDTALNLEAALERLGLQVINTKRDDGKWLEALVEEHVHGEANASDADDDLTRSDDEGK